MRAPLAAEARRGGDTVSALTASLVSMIVHCGSSARVPDARALGGPGWRDSPDPTKTVAGMYVLSPLFGWLADRHSPKTADLLVPSITTSPSGGSRSAVSPT